MRWIHNIFFFSLYLPHNQFQLYSGIIMQKKWMEHCCFFMQAPYSVHALFQVNSIKIFFFSLFLMAVTVKVVSSIKSFRKTKELTLTSLEEKPTQKLLLFSLLPICTPGNFSMRAKASLFLSIHNVVVSKGEKSAASALFLFTFQLYQIFS